ncbi:MAG: DUF3492 domain-containing protein [Planctomycetota bacterium]|nr:MAG: DUF3492 domain-containing protein [Planctomycetota bacterium]
MLDVCLVVEGTYPYVRGGVSAWVHDLVGALSTLRFGIVHVGAGRDAARVAQYPLPDNVERFVEVFIHDPQPRRLPRLRDRWGAGRRRREAFAVLEPFYEACIEGRPIEHRTVDEVLRIFAGAAPWRLTIEDLLGSREGWAVFERLAARHAPRASLVDLFWNVRFSHLPLARLLRTTVPEARVYHSPSTGYAGLLAAYAARRRGAALLVTEHGLYTREREIEIEQARWLPDDDDEAGLRARREPGLFKRWWLELFERMGRYAYAQSVEVITLFEGNRRLQLRAGAPPSRSLVIPNGVSLERFGARRSRGQPLERKAAAHVALVGRVVPIKDVKTFLRAARIVLERHEAVQIDVVGPVDEDEAYYRECLHEARLLGIAERVRFPGPVDVARLLEDLDCLVLTSLSEGQPLVVLEAMAAGVPVVATRVGACPELIEGADAADRALGAAGVVCPVGRADEVARAICRCLEDRRARAAMAAAGMRRVRRYYRRERVHALYEEIYQSYRDRHLVGQRFVDPGPGWGSFARALEGNAAPALARMGQRAL